MCDGISVIIPHYGDSAPTCDLVEQLRCQDAPFDVQIIVSDDASPEPFLGDLEDVVTVRRSSNGGFGAAVNAGVEVAAHDTILIINSDSTIGPGFLRELQAGAEPFMPAVVAPRVTESWGERIVGRRWPTLRGHLIEDLVPAYRCDRFAWYQRELGNITRSRDVMTPAVVDWVIGVCMLMPTAAFRAVGGIDERYFMNCEEIDLQRRLHEELGLNAVVLPSPSLVHVGGGSSDKGRRTGWLVDARMRYHEKWNGGPGLYVGLLCTAGVNFVWNSARRATGRSLTPFDNFVAQIARANHAWRTRR